MVRFKHAFYLMLSAATFTSSSFSPAFSKDSQLKQSIQLEKENFELTATIKDTTTGRYGPSMQVDYKVFKNGRPIYPTSVQGGRLIGCGRTLVESSGGVIKPIMKGSQQIGWFVRAGSICGNTFSTKVQMLVVSAHESKYLVNEFEAKDEIIVREADQGIEVWSAYQEWGKGGTAVSFFVPRMIYVNLYPSEFWVMEKKLNPDVTTWPKLQYGENYFPSYFVAGLNDFNSKLMRTAVQKFLLKDEESKKVLESIGLPSSEEELNKLVDAMEVSENSLNLFVKDPKRFY